MIPPPTALHGSVNSAESTLDQLAADASATPHEDAPLTATQSRSILRRGPARIGYIRLKCGASVGGLMVASKGEIAAEVDTTVARTGTDDSVMDEETAGFIPQAETLAAFDSGRPTKPDTDSSILLAANERRQLAAEVAAHRAKRVRLGLTPV